MDTFDTKSVDQDGSQQQTNTIADTSVVTEDRLREAPQDGAPGVKKKKRRRGKSKWRANNKPYTKIPWHQRRNPIGKVNRNPKVPKINQISQRKLHAPYNTNQFLMEVHMPEAEGAFKVRARTRDSSFSVDSEENYFYSLPEDEEDFLAKEFSSVYEDAQSERLAGLSREELVQENLLLEAKIESMSKRLRGRPTPAPSPKPATVSSAEVTRLLDELNGKLREQEDIIRELRTSNETLKLQNERLRSRSVDSSADSESDSSSSSSSSASSSPSLPSPDPIQDQPLVNGHSPQCELSPPPPLVNGYGNHDESSDEDAMQ